MAWLSFLVVAGGSAALGLAGYWLVPPPEDARPADVIVVLAGGFERSLFAADLALRGVAPRVLVSRPVEDRGATMLKQYGVALPREEDIARTLLLRRGVADERIGVLGQGSRSTYEEGLALADLARQRPGFRLLVVTSPTHVRRAAIILAKALKGSAVTLQVVATPYEGFDRCWWRDQASARAVLLESAKLVFFVLGGHFASEP
jgi:uncharacterized SAM-binding protein YcdF (DUF218 family)